MKGTLPLAACALALLAACSRGEERPKELDLAPGFARVAYDAGRVEKAAAAPKDLPWPGDVDAALPPLPQVMVSRTVVRDAAAPPSNPDDPVLERARVSAGACFNSAPPPAGTSPPERSAHIVLTVIPTGTVTNADVSSDENNPRLSSCLHDQAMATHFSDNQGGPLRTYEIDVRVTAK